jgi:hypothetical protein
LAYLGAGPCRDNREGGGVIAYLKMESSFGHRLVKSLDLDELLETIMHQTFYSGCAAGLRATLLRLATASRPAI